MFLISFGIDGALIFFPEHEDSFKMFQVLPHKPGDPRLNSPSVTLLPDPAVFFFIAPNFLATVHVYMLAECKHEGGDFLKTVIALQQCPVQSRSSVNIVEWIIIFDFF